MNPQPNEADLPESLRRLIGRRRPADECPSATDAAAFVQDALDTERRATFLSHLGECRTCTEEVVEMRALLAHPSASVRAGKRAPERIAPRGRGTSSRPTTFPWAYAAAAAGLAVALTLYFATRNGEPKTSPQVAQGPTKTPTAQPNPPTKPPEEPTAIARPPDPPKDPLEGELLPPKPSEKPPEVVEAPFPEPEPPKEGTTPRGAEVEVASVAGSPEVRETADREWRALPPGQSILVASGNVAIRAGGVHAARVTVAGCVVSVEGKSEMTLTRDARGLHLALDRGGLLVDSADRFSEAIAIQAAGAVIDGPTLRCAVHLEGDAADVVSLDGEATITSGGRPVGVPKGHGSRVVKGQVATSPRRADLGAFLAWTREIEVFLPVEAEGGTLSRLTSAVRDAQASGGQYVAAPRQQKNKKSDEIYFEVAIDVEREGDYRILGHVAPGDYKSTKGSFRLTFDGGKERFLKVTGGGDEWQWSELEDTVRLSKGRHVLRIADPYGGHWFDSVLATTDPWFRPK